MSESDKWRVLAVNYVILGIIISCKQLKWTASAVVLKTVFNEFPCRLVLFIREVVDYFCRDLFLVNCFCRLVLS